MATEPTPPTAAPPGRTRSLDRQAGGGGAQGWTNVVLAAVLMLATLPGRTQGLGLITEPLLRDLKIDRLDYAHMNLWATLLGAGFCFPAGYLMDRFGARLVATGLLLLLGATVGRMSSFAGGAVGLFVCLWLTRACGQSALSVVSISVVGKSFGRRSGAAMGVYAFLLSAFFIVAFLVVGAAVAGRGWRVAWGQIAGALVLVVAPLTFLLLRDPAERPKGTPAAPGGEPAATDSAGSLRLSEALGTGAFWIFGLAAALFGLVSSGLGLFNEAVLAEHGFDQEVFHHFLAVTTLAALLGQLLCGWLARQQSWPRLMGGTLLVYAAGLAFLPVVRTRPQLWLLAALLGGAGGFITVIFFAIWGQAFGSLHLGRIQGAAQILTVIASAIGPLLFAQCARWTGSYNPVLFALGGLVLALALAAWRVSLPRIGAPVAAGLPAVCPVRT